MVPNGSSARMWWAKSVSIPAIFTCHLAASLVMSIAANQENICREDDHPPQAPIFSMRLTVCNYEANQVKVYSIETEPKSDNQEDEYSYCLKGQFLEKFLLVRENEDSRIILNETLDVPDLNIALYLIRKGKGSPSEERETVNALHLVLTIEDCNQVTWQTIAVAILSSACVVLISLLAIMLILFQQKGLIGKREDERLDESPYSAESRDNTFINPRRTSSYELTSLSRRSGSTLER